MNSIEVHNLSKVFELHMLQQKRITALQHIDMTIAQGEVVGLTGKSGSGKSSLMKCLHRTYKATSGEILYRSSSGIVDLVTADDHTIIALRRSEIRYCSQFLSVIPRVSAIDVVAAPLVQGGADKEQSRAHAKALLEALGLPPGLWDAYPVTFSGGEQQRVNVARAIIARPRLLLIDEPTASLDTTTKDIVIGLIRELREHGTAVLCISHDEHTLERLADRRLHLQGGHIITQATQVI